MNRNRDMWSGTIKPIITILAAIAGWVISMIFFVIGFSFGSQMMFGNMDVAFPVAVTVGLILTVIELAWNEEKEDLLDWAIWIFAYSLGIASNYYGLSLILGMADPNVEKIVAIALGSLIEIAPERMLIRGFQGMDFRFDLRGLIRSAGGFVKSKQGQRSNKDYTRTAEPTYHNLNVQQSKPKQSHRPGNFPGPNDFLGGK